MATPYMTDNGWTLCVEALDSSGRTRRLEVVTGDTGTEPPAYLGSIVRLWAASVVQDRDRRDDIDKLGAAVGVDTSGERLKSDALKALRAHGG